MPGRHLLITGLRARSSLFLLLLRLESRTLFITCPFHVGPALLIGALLLVGGLLSLIRGVQLLVGLSIGVRLPLGLALPLLLRRRSLLICPALFRGTLPFTGFRIRPVPEQAPVVLPAAWHIWMMALSCDWPTAATGTRKAVTRRSLRISSSYFEDPIRIFDGSGFGGDRNHHHWMLGYLTDSQA